MNIGVRREMESYVDLILRELGEIINLAHWRGNVERAARSFGESRRAWLRS